MNVVYILSVLKSGKRKSREPSGSQGMRNDSLLIGVTDVLYPSKLAILSRTAAAHKQLAQHSSFHPSEVMFFRRFHLTSNLSKTSTHRSVIY